MAGQAGLAGAKLVVLDHHPTSPTITTADLIINQPEKVATGQLIYELAKSQDWPLTPLAAKLLAASILSDSLGLTSQALKNNSAPIRVLADLVDLGGRLEPDSTRKAFGRANFNLKF